MSLNSPASPSITAQLQAVLQGSCLSSADDFSVIEVSGVQAGAFLQGQLTCDIQAVLSGRAILGACCDHKGRMLANFWVGQRDNQYYLILPQTQRDIITAHLKKYGAFSKITVSEQTDWMVVNYCSTQAPALSVDGVIQGESPLMDSSGRRLYWLTGPAADLQTVRQILSANAVPVDLPGRQLLAILAHLVFIQPATRDLFIPQMIGLEKLGGVSFTKGCYLGQEVIARIQHLGQLKRHLHEFRLNTAVAPQIGDECRHASGEAAGHVAAVSPDLENGYRVLAVIQDRLLKETIMLSNAIMENID